LAAVRFSISGSSSIAGAATIGGSGRTESAQLTKLAETRQPSSRELPAARPRRKLSKNEPRVEPRSPLYHRVVKCSGFRLLNDYSVRAHPPVFNAVAAKLAVNRCERDVRPADPESLTEAEAR
jgi:hypothetical protein